MRRTTVRSLARHGLVNMSRSWVAGMGCFTKEFMAPPPAPCVGVELETTTRRPRPKLKPPYGHRFHVRHLKRPPRRGRSGAPGTGRPRIDLVELRPAPHASCWGQSNPWSFDPQPQATTPRRGPPTGSSPTLVLRRKKCNPPQALTARSNTWWHNGHRCETPVCGPMAQKGASGRAPKDVTW